jgi:hypothetical protein
LLLYLQNRLSRDVVGDDHRVETHHIFPKALLRERGERRMDIDEIANLAFLMVRPNKQISKREPADYLSEIAAKHPDRLSATELLPRPSSFGAAFRLEARFLWV